VLVRWGAELPAGQRDVLGKLVELLPYIGRADSVCEARLLEDSPEPDETWWQPGGSGDLRTRLLAPIRPVSRPALEISTVEVRRSRRMLPVGSHLVGYAAERPLRHKDFRRIARQETPTVEAVRFAVVSAAPMRATHGVLLADKMHEAVGRDLERANVDDGRRQLLLGTNCAATDHQHMHWIPVPDSEQRGASVTSLVLWVPYRLRPVEVAAFLRVHEFSGKVGGRGDSARYEVQGFPAIRLLFQAAGPIEQVAPELCGPSAVWRSRTPYLPVRHRKGEPLADYLSADVAAELRYREPFLELPRPAVTLVETDGRLPDRWSAEFRRYRLRERMQSSRPGLGVRLEFAQEIRGPLLLGKLSHFGYGMFAPES